MHSPNEFKAFASQNWVLGKKQNKKNCSLTTPFSVILSEELGIKLEWPK